MKNPSAPSRERTAAQIKRRARVGRRSISSMVEDILDDYLKNMLTGRPKKYLSFEEQSAAGRKLGDMLLPNGKRLNDCTGPELMAVGKAYQAAGKEIGRHRGTDLIPWSASRLVDRWEQRSGT